MRPLLGSLMGSTAALLIIPPVSAGQSSITVNLSGVRSQKGNIVVCLWKSQAAKDFPLCSKTASFQQSTVKAAGSRVSAIFRDVPSGEYAISAFHDENQDGQLNRGAMGRPKEGLAISNLDLNQGRRERPSFNKAKFTVNGAKTMSMSLMYR
jgi:uncharacterized protein (DUF2141 family)